MAEKKFEKRTHKNLNLIEEFMRIGSSIISSEECRLDKLLTRQFPKYSRTYFQYLIEEGCVLVNGQRVKKKDIPNIGDEIEVCFRLTPEISLEPQNIPLDILYEDDHLIVVNKPAGMVVHPAPGNPDKTFVNALLYHCAYLPKNDQLRPGIVHRLDKETSGVLIAAKTSLAHQRLISLFCERKIEKKYLAVCLGNPGNKTIEAPIRRHPTKRKEMAVLEGGKPAVSRCRVLAEKEPLFLVEVELITGRTHQIRVHMKHNGTPILGDSVYGSIAANQKYGTIRQLLHARFVKFVHPVTGALLEFSAPVPQEILQFFP